MEEEKQPKNIYKLFYEFRKKVQQPVADKNGYQYKYADLPSLQAVVKEALPVGLDYYQNISSAEDYVSIQTIFFDTEGEFIMSGELHLPQTAGGKMNNIQAIGSTITYGRRYQLSAMAGVASEEDDDANSNGNSRQSKPYQKQQSRQQQNKPKRINATKSQITQTNNLVKQIADIKGTNAIKVYESYKVSDVNTLSNEQCNRFIKKLETDLASLKKTMQQQANQQHKTATAAFDKAVDEGLPF